MRSTVKSWTLASAPRAPDSSAFAQLSSTPLRTERLRADPALRSVTHRCAKPPRQAISPASASPVLATETLASSLAYAAPGHALAPNVCLASGRAGQLVLPPSLLSLPVQKPEQRDPAPHDTKSMRARLPAFNTARDDPGSPRCFVLKAGRLALDEKSVSPLAVRVPR